MKTMVLFHADETRTEADMADTGEVHLRFVSKDGSWATVRGSGLDLLAVLGESMTAVHECMASAEGVTA